MTQEKVGTTENLLRPRARVGPEQPCVRPYAALGAPLPHIAEALA